MCVGLNMFQNIEPGVLGLHFQICLVVRIVPTSTVKQTSCENNERGEWKTPNALSEGLTRTREARCCKYTLISIVIFMGWPLMYGTDLWLVLLCTLSFRADLGHGANRAWKKVHSFDVKCLHDRRVELSGDSSKGLHCQSYHGFLIVLSILLFFFFFRHFLSLWANTLSDSYSKSSTSVFYSLSSAC